MVAATVPDGTNSIASRQSVLDASDGSARKGAISVAYRSARPLRCANRECALERAAYAGLSRRAPSAEEVDVGTVKSERGRAACRRRRYITGSPCPNPCLSATKLAMNRAAHARFARGEAAACGTHAVNEAESPASASADRASPCDRRSSWRLDSDCRRSSPAGVFSARAETLARRPERQRRAPFLSRSLGGEKQAPALGRASHCRCAPPGLVRASARDTLASAGAKQ